MVRRGDVRRAKLYYLRDLRGKAAKIKERRGANNEFIVEDVIAPEAVVEAPVLEEQIVEVVPATVVETPVMVEESTKETATETEQA